MAAIWASATGDGSAGFNDGRNQVGVVGGSSVERDDSVPKLVEQGVPGEFALKPRWGASWNLCCVEGLMINADYRIWGRLRNNDHKPSKNRSITEKLGARFRERLITGAAVSFPRLRLNEIMLS